ncbi:MAG: hypothetical protein U1F83_05865 [Verrucomicrobiota bacterium]
MRYFAFNMSSTQVIAAIMVGKPSVVVASNTTWRISSGVQPPASAR